MTRGEPTAIQQALRIMQETSPTTPTARSHMTVGMVRELLERIDELESVLKEACDDLDSNGHKSGFRLRIKGGIDP